jgi:hypothetical protein
VANRKPYKSSADYGPFGEWLLRRGAMEDWENGAIPGYLDLGAAVRSAKGL